MAKAGPLQFLKEVKAEVTKVTWPTRRETVISTIAVFFMVFVVAMFLYFADQIISFAIRLVIGV